MKFDIRTASDGYCSNCFMERADHDYVPDSISKYKCPIPHVEMGYGYFNGGDPRSFYPDHESCSETEISNHRAACRLWDEAEHLHSKSLQPEDCPSGWIQSPGGTAIHILRSPYGIGTYSMHFDQFFELLDQDETGEDDDN